MRKLLKDTKTLGPVLLLAIALAYLFMRGPWRAAQQTVDLPTFYGAAQAWVLGENPYDHATIKRLYDSAGGDGQNVALCVNPPSFMPLMAPLGMMPYQPAKFTMIGINLLALGLAAWMIGRHAGLLKNPTHAVLFFAAAASLASVHTAISQGQHGILVLLLLGLAMRAERSTGKGIHIGLGLALAAALKPQMVVLFGFYYLARRRWPVVLAGLLGTAGLLAIGITRMEAVGIDWLDGIRANLAAFTSAEPDTTDMSGLGNYEAIGDSRFIMLDVATLVHSFTHHEAIVKTIRFITGAAILLAAWRLAPRRSMGSRDPLLLYALLSVGCLVTSYNRFYAATVLVLVIAAAMRLILVDRQRIGWALLALCAPFVLPTAAILRKLQAGPLADTDIVDNPLWRHLLLPHQTYLLLGLLVLLGIAMHRLRSEEHSDQAPMLDR